MKMSMKTCIQKEIFVGLVASVLSAGVAVAEPATDRPEAPPDDFGRNETVVEPVECGEDCWGGRISHPAKVNAVGDENNPNVIRLRGEWEFFADSTPKYYWHFRDFQPRMTNALMKVSVPGCWEASGVGSPGPGVGGSSWGKAWRFKARHVGSGYYRTRVRVPASWKDRRIWLKEGGVRNVAWFWLNGSGVGMVGDNFGARKWDVTPIVRPGAENTVFVEVNNEFPCRNPGAMSYHSWGGLIRDVELEATPDVCIDDAWVRGNFDSRTAEVHVKVDRGGSGARRCVRVRATVEGEMREVSLDSEQALSACVIEIPLRDFRPWSPERPNLYWADIELVENGCVIMTRRERFGVRKLEIRNDCELYLNGHPYFLRGFGDDAVYPLTGFSPASRDEHLKHLMAAHRAGFNYVRTHTHCELPEYFEAADEAGVFVQAELGYYRDLSSEQLFHFDPIGDARLVMENYRRHPSLAIYSGGNEGMLGPIAGKLLYRFLKRNDPDRLVVEQDGGWSRDASVSDIVGGPMNPWRRGAVRDRVFICHEYLNLAVKDDYRNESRYTGVAEPLVTAEMRRAELAKAKLDDAWGERLQDAQNALQGFWQKYGIEHARKDPFCDGFCYWTIVDFSHRGGSLREYPRAQGYFNQFWESKEGGLAPEDFAVFNSATCLLIDTEDKSRDFSAPEDHTACGSYDRGIVIEETNRVYTDGDEIAVEIMLAHYGDTPLVDAKLEWAFVTPDGTKLLSGSREVGDQAIGAARTLAKERLRVPAVEKPVKATLHASVSGVVNAWDFYFVPHVEMPRPANGTVVARLGAPEIAAARRDGKNLLIHANTEGAPNIYLNWWDLKWGDRDVTGAAAVPHEVWGDFPFEPRLAPNLMRIFRKGKAMPVNGFAATDAVMITEGATHFSLNLAAKIRPDGGREVFVSGLDVFSRQPEARLLLKNIYDWLAKRDAIK